MTRDIFRERERALEDEFFHRVDERLLANLRKNLAEEAKVQRLRETTGFDDEDLLRELVELGVSAPALAAISLAPLVLVAWSNGNINTIERQTILEIAHGQGVTDGSPAAKLLDHWLKTEPGPEFATTWQHFVQATCDRVSNDVKSAMQSTVMRQAEAVARAATAQLGSHDIPPMEKRTLAELSQVFDESK